jgi:putative FmdB family regulatory protein
MRFAPAAKEVHMPIYEYTCLDCRRRVSVFFRTFAEAGDQAARCPVCQGANLRRLVSKVTVLRSEGSRLDSMADESFVSGLENEDPRALAGMMRKMSDEMGEPLDPEMHEVVQRLERGESPEAIEQSMPGLGAEGGGELSSGGDDF